MADTQRKNSREQDSEKAQEKRKRPEPAPEYVKALADESIPLPRLFNVSAMELPIERHAALLGEPRFSHSANNAQKAGMVTELQGTYGNAYVQNVVGLIQAKQDKSLVGEEGDLGDIERQIVQQNLSGQPLEPETRSEMEASFNQDFGPVRIHADANAAKLVRELGAKAFTTRKDIFFADGAYEPSSKAGRTLIAHELIHTIQQKHAVNNAKQLYIGQSDDSFEQEANELALRVVPQGSKLGKQTDNNSPSLTVTSQQARNSITGTFTTKDAVPRLATNNAVIQRQSVTQVTESNPPRGAESPPNTTGKAPDATAMIGNQYPHLATVLTGAQVRQVQKVLDARFKMKELEDKREPLAGRIESEIVRQREALDEQIGKQFAVIQENKFLKIPMAKLLANDILPKGDDSVKVTAFKDNLFKKMISYPVILLIREGLAPSPMFSLHWGPGKWELTHSGGLIRFNDLMKIQKLNLAYQLIINDEMAKLTGEMAELARGAGGALHNMMGKKVGEIWSWAWNSSVKVGLELGSLGGYYDDNRGYAEVYSIIHKYKGAKIVLKAPDGWLHVYAIDPGDLKVGRLTSPDDDGFGYILDIGSQVSNVWLIETADYIVLKPGATKSGSGWRCPEDPSKMTKIEEFAVGAIFGDAFEDATVASTTGQIIIGVIPIVGQIADARDVAIGIHKIWSTGGKAGWAQTGLALVGFIPILGDYIKSAAKAGKKAVAKAIQKATPELQQTLARRLLSDPQGAAKWFGVTPAQREAVQNVIKGSEEALAKGDLARYADNLKTLFDQVGGNAAALVKVAGGNWKELAKRLTSAGTDSAKDLAQKMQKWRKQYFESLPSSVGKEIRATQKIGAANAEITGTPSVLSDIDMSFLGPNSSTYKNAAIKQVEQQFKVSWKEAKELFDVDIMADPRRLHLFEEVGGEAAKKVEKAMVEESELNVLAKMLRNAKTANDIEKVQDFAKGLGVDMKKLAAREEEIAKLASDTDLYRRTELEMDNLHAKFLAEKNPAKKADIAQEMATTQSKLNAAVKGPYLTPGGVAKHVTYRDLPLRPAGAFKPISPAMGYMAVLDDLVMLEKSLQPVAEEGFSSSVAKDMAKYADRLTITAGQHGTDMAKAKKARILYEKVDALLAGARKDPEKLAAQAEEYLKDAKGLLEEQLAELSQATKKNADAYLADVGRQAERRTVLQTAEEARKALNKQRAMLLSEASILLRKWVIKEEARMEKTQ